MLDKFSSTRPLRDILSLWIGLRYAAHLKDPESYMWERRKGIVAHVLTPGLLRVADKFALLIVVDGFATDGRQHDAEDDEHRQPDLPHEGGVVGDLIQQTR